MISCKTEITTGNEVQLDDFPVRYNTDVEVHRTEPSVRLGPETESGLQSKNCLVTSQFLQDTGEHFHWHSFQLHDSGRIEWAVPRAVLEMPLMWSHTEQLLFMPCLQDTNPPAPGLRAVGSIVWCDCGMKLWFGTFAILRMGKGSKISCAIDQLKSAARVQAPKRLHASQRSHTPSRSALVPHMCATLISN